MIGLLASQAVAVALVEATDHTRAMLALSLVVGDLILLAAVLAAAARGAERLGAATFGTSPVAKTSGTRRGTASLVLGILSALTFLIPIVSVILGVIAVSLALTSRGACQRSGRVAPWQANAGLVLGALGIIAGIGIFIAALATA